MLDINPNNLFVLQPFHHYLQILLSFYDYWINCKLCFFNSNLFIYFKILFRKVIRDQLLKYELPFQIIHRMQVCLHLCSLYLTKIIIRYLRPLFIEGFYLVLMKFIVVNCTDDLMNIIVAMYKTIVTDAYLSVCSLEEYFVYVVLTDVFLGLEGF